MQMRMFPWDLGLLDWTWNILMIADFAVEPLQIVNGKPRQGIFVLPHLIGAAAVFATLQIESKKCIDDVVKVKIPYGTQIFSKIYRFFCHGWHDTIMHMMHCGSKKSCTVKFLTKADVEM